LVNEWGNMIRAYVNNAAYFQATGKNSLFNSSFSMLFIILTALPNEFLLPKCLRINLRKPIFSLSIICTTPRIRSHSKYDIKNENTDAIFICSNWNKAKFIIFVRNISTAIVTFVEPTWFNYYDKKSRFPAINAPERSSGRERRKRQNLHLQLNPSLNSAGETAIPSRWPPSMS